MGGNPEDEKLSFISDLRILIEEKIDRPINVMETRALAFFVERHWKHAGRDPEQYLVNAFHIHPEDSAFEIQFKIHNAIYDEKQKEVKKRIAENSNNPDEVEKLEVIKNLMVSSHRDILKVHSFGRGKITLGGVADYWLPDWASYIVA